MKLLTRNTDYAVRAISYMAREKDRIITVTELVRHLKVPRPFLRKILQTLSKKGVVESRKGIGGGFLLARPSGRIHLVSLIEIFQGPLSLNECMFRKMLCPNRSRCALKKKMDAIEKHVESELRSITIKDISGE